jgi:hypothetical protein
VQQTVVVFVLGVMTAAEQGDYNPTHAFEFSEV